MQWADCHAHARHLADSGRETVVVCDLTAHGQPDDATEMHYDESLDIWWRYADGYERDDYVSEGVSEAQDDLSSKAAA